MLNRNFHPFFFASYPIIALASANVGKFALVNILRPLLIVTIATGIIMVILKLLLRQWHRAAFVTSLLALWIMAYGLFFNAMDDLPELEQFVFQSTRLSLKSNRDALIIWTILFAVIGLFLMTRKQGTGWIPFFNIMIMVSLTLAIARLIQWHILSTQATQLTGQAVSTTVQSDALPDIYHIVLDGHGRADTLAEFYDYDAKPFIAELESLGFYVADQSSANYHRTYLSLFSTYNYTHLTKFDPKTHTGSFDIWRATEEGRFIQDLKQAGYETTAITTNFVVDFQTFDNTFFAVPNSLTYFESILLQSTIPHVWFGRSFNRSHRFSLEAGFERINNVPNSDSPRFVFAHFLLPHPPFVYNADGSIREDQVSRRDGEFFQGSHNDYYLGYQGQIAHVNNQILDVIKELVTSSENPTVVIIQGDHGPGAMFHFGDFDQACMRERYPILNAFYYSEGKIEGLYPEISPVNNFRVLANQFLGEAFRLLDDSSYYSLEESPFNFIDVSDLVASQDCSMLDHPNK